MQNHTLWRGGSDAHMNRRWLRVGLPLLAPSARRWARALVVCCAFLVTGLGLRFAHQSRADPFDHAIDSPIITWFGRHPGLAPSLASPGSLVPAAVLSAAVVLACLIAGRLNGAVLALVAVPVSVGLVERLFKPVFDRTYLGVLAFPSGHTTAVFAVACSVTVLLLGARQSDKPPVLHVAIPVATGLLGCLVAAAVIGLQWHYFTDTVAGAAVGIGTVCGLALLLDLATVRSWLARAVSLLGAGDGSASRPDPDTGA
jgi:membrane-associated phospholipid phosphatase